MGDDNKTALAVGSGRPDNQVARDRVRAAVAAGDPVGMVQELFHSGFLDGLNRWLRRKWGRLEEDQVDYAVAAGANALYTAIKSGRRVLDPFKYILRAAVNVASQLDTVARRQDYFDPDKIEELAARASLLENQHHLYAEETEEAERRRGLLQVCRRVAATIPQEKPRQAVELILDALEAGDPEISNEQIAEAMGTSRQAAAMNRSRGLRQLRRRAEEMGVLRTDSDFLTIGEVEDGSDETD